MGNGSTRDQPTGASQRRSRRVLYRVHLVTSVVVLAAQILMYTPMITYETMWTVLIPLGSIILAVFLFSIIQTIRLGTPRWRGVALTILLFPGSAVPLIGSGLYFLISILCISSLADKRMETE